MKRFAILALPLSLVASIVACSSAADVVLGSGPLAGTGGEPLSATGGASPSGGTAVAGGTGGAGGTGAGGLLSIPPSSAGGSSGGACAGVVHRAEQLPADVYIMFDQSASMGEPLPPPAEGTWWSAAQQALEGLVADPGLGGVSVGLQFFPLADVAPASCSADYATPEVAIGALPGNAAALVSAIRSHQPTGFTPTGPALAGAIAHVEARAIDYPGHMPAVIFVTDGLPTDCEPQELADIAEIARQGYESKARVRTYVIGLNMNLGAEGLNLIAEAGGTAQATLIDGSADVASALVTSMRTHAGTSNPCRIDIPIKLATGEPLDVSEINVIYESPSGGENPIQNVLDDEDCGGQANAGYYVVGSQNRIEAVLCPRTCTEVQPGFLRIELGCSR